MSTPLICDRCGKEILPGTPTYLIGLDEDARIIMADQMLVTHANCPEEEGAKDGSSN